MVGTCVMNATVILCIHFFYEGSKNISMHLEVNEAHPLRSLLCRPWLYNSCTKLCNSKSQSQAVHTVYDSDSSE